LTKPRFIVKEGQLKLLENPIREKQQYQQLLDNPKNMLAKFGVHDYFYNNHYHTGTFDFLASAKMLKIVKNYIKMRTTNNDIDINDRYNPESKAFKLLTELFKAFSGKVKMQDSLPIIIIFPTKDDIDIYQMTGEKTYQPLIEALETEGLEFIDLMKSFEDRQEYNNTDQLFIKSHYSFFYTPFANKLVAKYLFHELKRRGHIDIPNFLNASSN